MFVGEGDTGEPFSIGLKLGKKTYYLKAENRLELDNWSRVLKPFVQASPAYIPRRNSSTSSASSTESDVFTSSEQILYFSFPLSVMLNRAIPFSNYYFVTLRIQIYAIFK